MKNSLRRSEGFVASKVVMAPVSTEEVNAAPQSSSKQDIWVNGLDSELTDSQIVEFFEQVAQVLSIYILRRYRTKYCVGFGCVTFSNKQDAINVRDSLNSKCLNGKPVRIVLAAKIRDMEEHRCAKLFVSGLDASIDSEYFRKVFSDFGTIISCKVDWRGHSKGYGYVQYEKEEDAVRARDVMTGMVIGGHEIFVCYYTSKQVRDDEMDERLRTTVYVKNLSEDTDSDSLISIFDRYGRVRYGCNSAAAYGQRRGTGFITFEIEEEADDAVEKLNGYTHDGKTWQVERARTKSERKAAAMSKLKQESGQAATLHVRNIDSSINDEKLKELFSQFGRITSCKVMLDCQGRSKGFGSVAFSTPEEASKAVNEMSGRMRGSKPLYVAVAHSKEKQKVRSGDVIDVKPLHVAVAHCKEKNKAAAPECKTNLHAR